MLYAYVAEERDVTAPRVPTERRNACFSHTLWRLRHRNDEIGLVVHQPATRSALVGLVVVRFDLTT